MERRSSRSYELAYSARDAGACASGDRQVVDHLDLDGDGLDELILSCSGGYEVLKHTQRRFAKVLDAVHGGAD